MQRSRVNLSFLRAVACVVLIVALCMSLAACNLFDRSNNKQQTVPNSTPNSTPDNTPDNTPDEEKQPDEQKQPEDQKQPEEQKRPEEQEQPSEEVEPDLTREEFESELEAKIVEGYNLRAPSYAHIQGAKILTINESEENSAIYYEAYYRGNTDFGIANVKNDALQGDTYREILKNLTDIEYPVIKSRVTEHGVPEDICAYALSQPKVHDFLTSRGITSSEILNYKVINTTEFTALSQGRLTDITMMVGDYIVTLTLGGITGACDSQREYLHKLQNGRLRVVENIVVTEYRELALNSAY